MKKLTAEAALICIIAAFIAGCGASETEKKSEDIDIQLQDSALTEDESIQDIDALAVETASDGTVDIQALQEQNPDIFGWIYIPGTGIDEPLLQNTDDGEFYRAHDAYGELSDTGAAYLEYSNNTDLCDFNSVIYGLDREEILSFENPDVFNEDDQIHIYTADDHITYKVVMARKWTEGNILENYAFSINTECTDFLRDILDTTSLSDNVSDDFANYTYMDLFVTLSVEMSDDGQFFVMAVYMGDENGTVSRNKRENDIPGIQF